MAREGMTDYEKQLMLELTAALETLIEKYVIQGTNSEFISCITPKEVPWYWIRAKQAVARTREYLAGKD